MRFEILGPVAAFRGDEEVTPRGAQQRRLLAALVMGAPDPVGVDALNELLWPAGPPSTNALQAQVSKLRRVIEPVGILASPRGYALAVDPAHVDAVVVQRELEAGTELLADDPAAAADVLERARRRVRGEPLVDLAEADLARGERARVARLVEALDDRRVDALLAGGRSDQVEALVESLLASRPLDEHLWAQLMRAQYRAGRQADALRTFQRVRRLLADELGVAPGPELAHVEQQVLHHDPTLLGARPVRGDGGRPDPTSDVDGPPPEPRRRRSPAVPARLSSFVGRDDLLAAVDAALARARLVTLQGPGGVGKTTTALEVVRRGVVEPVHLVDLAPVRSADPDTVAHTVLEALGDVEPDPVAGRDAVPPLDRLVDGIGELPVVLLIDNCEHVVDAAAEVVHGLLETCSRLRVLATSREALGVPGEQVMSVPPLPVDDGVELFVQRARAVGAEPAADRHGEVAAVVERLDGLPLAIELAAARTRSLTVPELHTRLEDRFALLSSGPRTVDERQQTLRNVVEWSHALLDAPEQRVFRRLAAFSGGATAAAVEAVCGDDELSPSDVLAVLDRLVDKSLVVADRRADEVRYRLLETIGAFAAERLLASDDLDEVLDAHAAHVADQLAPALRGLMSSEQHGWLDRLAAERDNLRVALDHALARSDAELAMRLVAPVGWWAYITGQFDWGAQVLDDALGCPGMVVPADRALVLGMYAWLVANGPDVTIARAAADEGLALLAATDDAWIEALVRTTWMMVAYFQGDVDGARQGFDDALSAAHRAGDPWALAVVELARGELLQADGTAADAVAAFDRAAQGFDEVGDVFSRALSLGEASDVYEQIGEYDRAAALRGEAVRVADASGFSPHAMSWRAGLANVEILRGELDRAEQLHRQVVDALDDQPFQWFRAVSWSGLAMIERRRGDPEAASRWLERAARLRRTSSVPHMRGLVLVAQGYTADMRGDAAAALAHQREGLAIHLELGVPRSVAYSLEGVAGALAADPDPAHHGLAARLLGCADALRRAAGGPMPAAERFDVDRAERRLRASLGGSQVEELIAAGSDERPADLVAELAARVAGAADDGGQRPVPPIAETPAGRTERDDRA